MSLKYGKSEIKAMVEAIDQDHETAEVAAEAALATAEEIFEKRSNFVVVGQVVATKDKGRLKASDPDAVKVSLGWYSTEGDATKAAESLWTSTASGDELHCWVLPVFHGSPAAFHTKQKEKYAEAERKRKEKASQKMQDSIEKRRQAMEERARGGKGSCQACQHQSYDHMRDGSSRGRCALTDCGCEKWVERTK